jgi:hypothetical protein
MNDYQDFLNLKTHEGVGSEVYGAVSLGRRGIGIELKESYFRQAIKNMEIAVEDTRKPDQSNLFDLEEVPA